MFCINIVVAGLTVFEAVCDDLATTCDANIVLPFAEI